MSNYSHKVKSIILLVSAIAATTAGSPLVFGHTSEFEHAQFELPDTSSPSVSRDSSRNFHWVTIEIMLGTQFLSTQWEPYSKPIFLGASCQRRFGESPLWLDASILVGRAGEVDQFGAGNGPGATLINLRAGLGHWWEMESSPLSFFVGGGISYVDASLLLWEGKQSGGFFGGYTRCGLALNLSDEVYVGIGVTANITTNRTLVDRDLNINSTALVISIGARN